MKLTDVELEVMNVLWKSGESMTASDIVAASPKRTWKESSIHVILKILQEKNAVVIERYVPTTGRNAKAFKASVTKAEYVVSTIRAFDVPTQELLEVFFTDGKKVFKNNE